MEPARLYLLLSTIAFVAGLVHAIVAIRAGQWRESRWHIVPMAVGFIFQTLFLYERVKVHGHCPRTNLLEIYIFIGWSLVLLYFLVGTAYRLSLLGVFTAPLLAALQTFVLLSPMPPPSAKVLASKVNPWLEMHASLALMSYAAFALACVTGVMFLMQDYLLKQHRIHALFHQLPPIQKLSKAVVRMVALGVALLSVAMVFTFKIVDPIPASKLYVGWGILAFYAVILLLMWFHTLGSRHTAWLAVLGFAAPVLSLWVVTSSRA
ncbi:cytochrome c biogenesis protein CcsA [Roseimicrobium sp. ORNL1]|uniref:cytochrome c biogenesis protein CcsA n=1 Tax=Roseimicrobium sp. ORNL1 TaxID=2711231 RepID=UPI0013E19A54|nr:cytochrome c biogenesis protein CcsA [Roseimicrobium sp. ORNL1]QIF04601.1 cytochrome c biogenesis protein CcsA [Roseimicrobium sp. ORNL1]